MTSTEVKKSYIAISRDIPQIGKRYECYRMERGILVRASTSTVRGIRKLSQDVFVVMTKNSYYITKILYLPEENVHFAKIYSKPELGKSLICEKIEFTKGGSFKAVLWQTTPVRAYYHTNGLYKVETRNSTYVCYPTF